MYHSSEVHRDLTWHAFARDTASLSDLLHTGTDNFISASTGVDLLLEVFGSDRHVLVLVDEISKAGDGMLSSQIPLMKELGNVLDTYENVVDVLVSTLAPIFINVLFPIPGALGFDIRGFTSLSYALIEFFRLYRHLSSLLCLMIETICSHSNSRGTYFKNSPTI